jgi:orotate phosphoribosyltransferase-like protein
LNVAKLHQSPEFLKKAMSAGLTSRDIASELRVSYKLVELYLEKHQIPFKSQKPKDTEV